MTVALAVIAAVLLVALAAVSALLAAERRPAPPAVPAGTTRRILFPFTAAGLSRRALDAALRLARAEDATLVPVVLARVPLALPLEAPLPRQSTAVVSLQEAIEQRAAQFGVPVDARVHRGRTPRHALRETIADERFERMVIAADVPGFGPDDVAWLLRHAPGEIVVIRPGPDDEALEPGERITAPAPVRRRTTALPAAYS
jgi:nucleotide-binding universal stress UspA family protein